MLIKPHSIKEKEKIKIVRYQEKNSSIKIDYIKIRSYCADRNKITSLSYTLLREIRYSMSCTYVVQCSDDLFVRNLT